MGNKSSKSSLKSSYTWKLPNLITLHIDLLCNAFIRTSTPEFIPTDIIHLCKQYFNDDVDIESIRNSKNGVAYKSNTFSINQFKFYMDLYPNGYDLMGIGIVDLLLNILSIPPNISKVKVKYNLSLNETNTNCTQSSVFNRQNIGYSWNQRLRIDKIKTLDTISITLHIKRLKIYYINDDNDIESDDESDDEEDGKIEEMRQKTINITPNLIFPSGEYTWNINSQDLKNKNTESCSELSNSDIFAVGAFKWMLEICTLSDGQHGVVLSLVALSSNIWTVYIHYQMGFTNADDIVSDGSAELHSGSLFHVICSDLDIDNTDITCVWIRISIIDVFDDDGHSLSTYHLFQNNSLKTIQTQYEWNISDRMLLSKMKTCPFGTMFVSPCFETFGVFWCLRFYPNGYDHDMASDNTTTTCLMLNLVSTPPNIDSIAIIFELILVETATKGLEHQRFRRDSFWGWEHADVDILPFDTLTLQCNIRVVDVYDENGKPVDGVYCNMDNNKICKPIELQSMQFVWNINDINMMKCIKQQKDGYIAMSPIFMMFNLKWYLELHPNPIEDADHTFRVFLSLATKPNIESISFRYTMLVNETNDEHSHYGQLFDEELSIGSDAMSPNKSILNTLNTLTLTLTLSVMDVWDKHGKMVKDQVCCIDEKQDIAEQLDFEYEAYHWKIHDAKMMKKIRKAKHFESFSSDVFMLNGFKFMQQICPNGSHLHSEGIFEWFLCLVSIPPFMSKVSVIYKIHLIEMDVMDNYRMELSMRCTSYGWGTNKLKFEHISNGKMKNLTFKLELAIIDVYTNDGNIITDKYKSLLVNSTTASTPYLLQTLSWKVKDKELIERMKNAKNGDRFMSPTFGDDIFKWNLFFYPNGKNKKTKGECILYLSLTALPINVSGVSIYFELYVKETATIWSYCTHLRKDKLCEGWETCRIKAKDIQHLKKFTFSAEISLIDVYDLSSNLVTDKYIE